MNADLKKLGRAGCFRIALGRSGRKWTRQFQGFFNLKRLLKDGIENRSTPSLLTTLNISFIRR